MRNISHQLYQIVSGISNANWVQHAGISFKLDKGFLSLFKWHLWVTWQKTEYQAPEPSVQCCRFLPLLFV